MRAALATAIFGLALVLLLLGVAAFFVSTSALTIAHANGGAAPAWAGALFTQSITLLFFGFAAFAGAQVMDRR